MLRLRTRPWQSLNSARTSVISHPRLQCSSNFHAPHAPRALKKKPSGTANRKKTIPLDDVFDGLDGNTLGFGKQNRNGQRSRVQHTLQGNPTTKASKGALSPKLPSAPKRAHEAFPQNDAQLYSAKQIRNIYRDKIPRAAKYGLQTEPSHDPKHLFEERPDIPVKVWFTQIHTRDSGRQHQCTLLIDVSTRKLEVKGHGTSQPNAESAAYLHAICKLEDLGLFGDMLVGGAYRYSEYSKSERQLETNAQIDVMNFAARHDCEPIFTTAKVRGTRKKDNYRSHVSIPGLGLDGYGKAGEATVALRNACISIKKNAEARHAQIGEGKLLVQDYTQLTISSAEKFVRFFNDVNKLYIEVTNEEQRGSGTWTARITISPRRHVQLLEDTTTPDYTFTGYPMVNKPHAENTAFLTAALHLKKEFPDIWKDFTKEIRRGLGDILRPLSPINMGLGPAALQVMEHTMLRVATADKTRDASGTPSPDHQGEEQRRVSRSRQLDPYMIKRKNDTLLEKLVANEMDPQLADLREKRSELPMVQHSDDVLKVVNGNEFCVVVGATGSGKTTQLPQLILDEMTRAHKGGTCNIICTQPRRIAATSVARRVAVERNEPIGQSVGYNVRFDSQLPQFGGSINYCTTGILLRQLQDNQDTTLDGISHIIMDEVHERDIQIDFLLVTLKRLMADRKAANKPAIKVILMSATIDTTVFCKYFGEGFEGGRCPYIEVPGRAFPVTQHFLDETYAELTRLYPRQVAQELYSRDSTKYVDSELALKPQNLANDNVSDGVSLDEDKTTMPHIDWSSKGIIGQDGSVEILEEVDDVNLPTGIMSVVIAHLLKTTTEGSILVFLPGYQEITALHTILSTTQPLGLDIAGDPNLKLYMLHSAIPQMQQEVFEKLRPGQRKIILSTNIAETSITIPDVVYVVDSSKQRENQFDPARNVSSLVSTWTSKSNARQRAGRAGRVQNGHYFTMATKSRYNSFAVSPTPEILRVDLKDLCLQVKSMGIPDIWHFLGQAIQPPQESSVENAIDELMALGALDENRKLTPLGRLLSTLPLSPALGKMVVLGAIFQCLDPILITAAASSSKDPFLMPSGLRNQAEKVREHFSQGTKSDHIAFINAYREWRQLRIDGRGRYGDKQFASDNFLHYNSLVSITQVADQIFEVLVNAGIVERPTSNARSDRSKYGSEKENVNSNSVPLQTALITAGLYPNVALQTNQTGPRHLRTLHENDAVIHVNSLSAPRTRDGKRYGRLMWTDVAHAGTLFAFGQKTRADGQETNLRSISKTSALSVVLFGGKVSRRESNVLCVDEWLPFYVPGRVMMPIVIGLASSLEQYMERTFARLGAANKRLLLGRSDPSSQGVFFDEDPTKAPLVSGIVQALELCAPQEYVGSAQYSSDDALHPRDNVPQSWSRGIAELISQANNHSRRPSLDLRSSESSQRRQAPLGNIFDTPPPPARFPSRSAPLRNMKSGSSNPKLEEIFKKWI